MQFFMVMRLLGCNAIGCNLYFHIGSSRAGDVIVSGTVHIAIGLQFKHAAVIGKEEHFNA